ncbi:hypothetical protein HDEF_0111 [Candidatus Hamiltonella defensa 5AT (Acyrthosiphon pisum)]|uniref:Uncharacterized protein n=1 Tax=Hamiltonella defensa subsp. Acyrthosiphon pisum (strain 5AT) TaxID=572265 RepID=C4K8P7_HAMD5|nr:hypothetical protein HDEF_0111 [Candidatus Hamiltonella defensa 5AT (Acyrthosiphon pisum)]
MKKVIAFYQLKKMVGPGYQDKFRAFLTKALSTMKSRTYNH